MAEHGRTSDSMETRLGKARAWTSLLKMSQPPKRSISTSYATLADANIPKRIHTCHSDNEDLEDVESSKEGHSSDFDEESGLESSDEEINASDGSTVCDSPGDSCKRFCLLEEITAKIKWALSSSLKGDPVCRIVMPFDKILFQDSLAVRGSKEYEHKARRSEAREVYTIPHLQHFNEVFGERWYIRGLNRAGDFCYVIPGTVSFYLRQTKRGVDYQLQKDGTLQKTYFGKGFQLVFSFVRGDGNVLQWNEVLKQCGV